MLLLRSTIGVRSIPERLMEWLLLFFPPGVFEAMLQQFGFDAKRYGLDAAVVVILALLAGLGYAALHRGWRLAILVGLGPAVWLVIMLGDHAADLRRPVRQCAARWRRGGHPWLPGDQPGVRGSAGVRANVDRRRRRPGPRARRARASAPHAAGGIGGTAAAFVATYASGMLFPTSARAPAIVLLDPQEPVPSGGLDEPNPHPQAVSTPMTQATAGPTPTVGVNATPALPRPRAARALQRDKDGAVLQSGRPAGQLASQFTSNADFYVVTKNAGGDPELKAEDWRLLVDGEVQRSFQLDYSTLRRLPSIEVSKTLECISNFVGKPELAPFGAELISTAKWKGVAVRDILALTGGPKAGAEWLAVFSADEYTSALPMEVAMDPATLLVYEMNGDVLPYEHGYPARLLVPGRYGMKNPKWVIGMRPMTREFLDWYGTAQLEQGGGHPHDVADRQPWAGRGARGGLERDQWRGVRGDAGHPAGRVHHDVARRGRTPSWSSPLRHRTCGCAGGAPSRTRQVRSWRCWRAPPMARAPSRSKPSRCPSRTAARGGHISNWGKFVAPLSLQAIQAMVALCGRWLRDA